MTKQPFKVGFDSYDIVAVLACLLVMLALAAILWRLAQR